ncbi:MAG: serine hydrolase [Hyphomicrobium sp.]
MRFRIRRHFLAIGILLPLSAALLIFFASQSDARRDWPSAAWQTDNPSSHGVSSSGLSRAESYAAANKTHSLLVIRHGRLIFEKYYPPFTALTAFDGKSVAKSLISIAIGRAVHEGLLPSIETPVHKILGDSRQNASWQSVTVRHALNMTTGIESIYADMIATSDWPAYIRGLPGTHPPGTVWHYKSDPMISSAVISAVAGVNARTYFQNTIGRALGLADFAWGQDPSGYTDGNGGALLTSRDMAKIGYLMLNDGMWNGDRLLPRDWVANVTFPSQSASRQYANIWAGATPTAITSPPIEYGLGWMCRKLNGVPWDAYWAFGGTGQFIVVIPSLDLVVVRTGSNGPSNDETVFPTLLANIVAAVADK